MKRGVDVGRASDEALVGPAAAQLAAVKVVSPAVYELLVSLAVELVDKDIVNQRERDLSAYRECPCGATVAMNRCDGSGKYDEFDHACPLTRLRRALSASGEVAIWPW